MLVDLGLGSGNAIAHGATRQLGKNTVFFCYLSPPPFFCAFRCLYILFATFLGFAIRVWYV